MPTGQKSHRHCDHELTREARELCRLSLGHETCAHPMTVTELRGCNNMREKHPDCDHGASYAERNACNRTWRAQEKE
jgi:hypothetical protein